MRHALISLLGRRLRPLAFALALAGGALPLASTAEAGGWHGGGWHGGWHGGGWGGWHGGCCWGGSSFSLFFGFPAYSYYPSYPAYQAYPYYPPYPAYGYAPSYAPSYYPPSPPVTMAQQGPPPGPAPVQYWYYCDNPRGYYPYVQNCGTGWKPVPAQPPGVQTP